MNDAKLLFTLTEVLRHARTSDFYRERLPAKAPASITEFKRIRFTTKADMREQSPYGLVCAPEADLLQYHESSATTGEPVSVFYSRPDLSEIHAELARWGVGLTPADRVLVRFPYALSTIGHFVHATAQHNGACVIPADSRSTITPMKRVIELMRKLDVTVLATLSFTAMMLAEAAETAGLDPRRAFPKLRAVACAGEPLPPYRRALVQELFGVPVFDNYGMTESGPLAMECPAHRMHPWTEHFYMEFLDEGLTRDALPGEIGQLVITSLRPRATPLVRYVTGDRVRRVVDPCECGQSTHLEIRGRVDDTIRLGGRPFDLWNLSAILDRLPCRRFWNVAPLPDGLRFVVEKEQNEDRVDADLLAQLEREHAIRLEVSLVPKGALYDRTKPMSFGTAGKPVYIAKD